MTTNEMRAYIIDHLSDLDDEQIADIYFLILSLL